MVSVPFVSGGWFETISLERAGADVDRAYAAMARIADRRGRVFAEVSDELPLCGCAGELGVRAAARSKEYQQLRQVPYAELLALNEHLGGGTPFATQHGVKGLEFNRVLAVVSKGHSRFQIPEMLANFSRRDELMDRELEAFIRARNLFYLACSRAREHLAILFTTKLEPAALDTLREWVGESRITQLRFAGDIVVGGE